MWNIANQLRLPLAMLQANGCKEFGWLAIGVEAPCLLHWFEILTSNVTGSLVASKPLMPFAWSVEVFATLMVRWERTPVTLPAVLFMASPSSDSPKSYVPDWIRFKLANSMFHRGAALTVTVSNCLVTASLSVLCSILAWTVG